VREATDQPLLAALNQLQPRVRCPEDEQPQTACTAIKAGTLLNIWLPSITGRVIAQVLE
jgi:hypothetical protein